ncbi:MAG: hypothetical protein JW750_08605 [Anaerolineaceae bacterium]|nr:hypothetical protein [Anaerolineaceae bacterium]
MIQKSYRSLLLFGVMLVLVAVSCSIPYVDSDVISTLISPPDCPTCEAVECEPCVECPTQEPTVEIPAATETPEPAAPTATPTLTTPPTQEPTQTQPPPTETAVPVVYEYQIQQGSPAYIPNVHHLDRSGAWMGAAGQVFAADGKPVDYVVVIVKGELGGKPLEIMSMTGVAPHIGPSGYEIELTDKPVDSTQALTIGLYDLAGKQLSELYRFDTFADASKHEIIINFVKK